MSAVGFSCWPDREELNSIKTLQGIIDFLTTVAASKVKNPLPQDQHAALPIDREQIKTQLLAIVSDRTGYPPDMLDLNLDLEADLGIDSIKRVEIFGILTNEYPELTGAQQGTSRQELNSIKTLQGIIDFLTTAASTQSDSLPENSIQSQRNHNLSEQQVTGDKQQTLPRFLIRMIPKERDEDLTLPLPNGSVFLITDDQTGISVALAEELLSFGVKPVIVQSGNELNKISENLFQADFDNPNSLCELISAVRKIGPIAGIIHLLPLKDVPDFTQMQLSDWRAWLNRNVKSLFYLAQVAGEDLKEMAASSGAWITAATSFGGNMAYGGTLKQSCMPGQGGIIGLLNTIATEWPAVHCKVVDCRLKEHASVSASCLIREITAGDRHIQVGYKDNQRYILSVDKDPLIKDSTQNLAIDSNSVLMITGGARGITAEVALELAEKYTPTIILIGRSDPPADNESPHTAGITSPGDLKKALIEQFQASNRKVVLAKVEKTFLKLCREREIRKNITAMQKAGAKVHYVQADASNETSFSTVIETIYADYGRLDGVIHGVGIIEDKLIESKKPDSFSRVFDTKADSAFILSKALHPDSLQFLVFFSSIASFGNQGQCDYAATNEVVNKLAIALDRQWPGRVLSVLWGPWAKTGMVSNEAQRRFTEQNIELIDPAEGRIWLDRELCLGKKGEVTIVAGGGPWEDFGQENIPSSQDTLPLMIDTTIIKADSEEIIVERTLTPAKDLYLNDHILDQKPVLPAVMAMELMAEVVQHNWPSLNVTSVHSLQVLNGIIIDNDTKVIRIHARSKQTGADKIASRKVTVEITGANSKKSRPFYKCDVHLGKNMPISPAFDLAPFSDLQPFSLSVEESYHNMLFHGSCFQGITAVSGISEQAICGTLESILPSVCLSYAPPNSCWLLDPIVMDSSLQLSILWERSQYDMTPLPVRINRFRKFGSLANSSVRCCQLAKTSNKGQNLFVDIYFFDNDNCVLGLLEGVEFICSNALNRLSQTEIHFTKR